MLRVENGESFQRCNFAQGLVCGDQHIKAAQIVRFQGHSKLECVEGSESFHAPVLDDESCCNGVMHIFD